MASVFDPSSLAFFALALAFLLRIRTAIRVPSSRLTWLATGFGALGLFCCGTLIPLPVMDGWFGGTNLISLFQNVLAATAFWLIMQAVTTEGRIPFRELTQWPLIVAVAGIIIPFLFIDRGTTAKDFMFDRADQVATFIYSAVYLVFIGGICTYLFTTLWKNRTREFTLIFVGSALLALGTFMQLVGLGAICFSWGITAVNETFYQIGLVGYTLGMAAIAANMVLMATMRALSARRIAKSIDSVEGIMRDRGVPAPHRLAGERRTPADDLRLLYEDVIAVNDHVQAEGVALSDQEANRVDEASTLISEKMFLTRQSRTARVPEMSGTVLRWAARDVKPKGKV